MKGLQLGAWALQLRAPVIYFHRAAALKVEARCGEAIQEDNADHLEPD